MNMYESKKESIGLRADRCDLTIYCISSMRITTKYLHKYYIELIYS